MNTENNATVVQPQQGVVTQQPYVPPFDPSKASRAYSNAQWTQKEDFYSRECAAITISDSPSPAEIQSAAVKIDSLLSIARIDYAFINQMYDKYSLQLKIEEKRLFVDLKLQPPSQYQGLKLTVDEMKGVVSSVIENKAWDNTKYSLYSLVIMSNTRLIFMENVIKILQDKKDLLITHNAMLKIESGLNGIHPSVPQNTPGGY